MKEQLKTTIGGQALIEGIVMRGPEMSAIVVRKSDGDLEIKEYKNNNKKSFWTKTPLLRGAVNLFLSMKEGVSALTYSAEFFDEIEEEPGRFEKWLMTKFDSKKMEKITMNIAVALGVLFPVGLFILLPTLLTGFFQTIAISAFSKNIIEGVIRISIFLCFMYFVSKMKDIRRTFSYHGAEHKTIACYEAGLPLTVENVRLQSRLHPRCGTSFLFVVMIVSILLFSLVSWSNPFLRVVYRLLLLPVVVGISYEFNRYAGRHDNVITNLLRAPGLLLQKLTTFEPDDDMIEVAIEAMKRVIPAQEGADAW